MTNQSKKVTTRRKPSVVTDKTPPVYFTIFEIENIFCFKEKQQLNLLDKNNHPAQWTVILGNNGVGKTTLLRCLASMEMKLDSFEDLDDEDRSYSPIISDSFKLVNIWNELALLEYSDEFAQVHLYYTSHITLTSFKEHANLEIEVYDDISVGIGSYCNTSGGALNGLICYGYGATRRMGETLLKDRLSSENSASLFSDNATLINAEEWLLQTDYAIKSSSGKPHNRFKKEFNIIIEALKRILPDVRDIHIAPADDFHSRPRAEFATPYGWVSLSSLGLGYRTTITWMVDLAVRLFKRYPDSEDPLAESAIVLVDEIDLHMHPQWQRTIMEFLTERFPNTQFIVTAHSPLVVQAAQDANIVLLRREGDRVVIDNNPEIIDNWRVDQVLTSVFEIPSARPPQIEKLLAERQEILSKPKISKADKAKLKELEEKIGALPTAENPDDIKAMDIIRRAAKLLEKSGAEAVE